MECQTARERLVDLVRDRLEPRDEADVREHLDGCAACRHEEAAERLLDEALAARLPPVPGPTALRRRIVGQLEAVSSPPDPLAPGRPRRAWPLALAAGLLLAAAGFGSGVLVRDRALGADHLVDELVDDHLRVLASAHPNDVESSDAHQVKPWFEGRLEFAPVIPGDRGELRLVGGALGYVSGRKAAVATYALRRHRVTLLAFPRAGVAGLAAASGDEPPAVRARRGFQAAIWTAGELGYALVADVGTEELGRLAGELAADTRR